MSAVPAGQGAPGKSLLFGVIGELVNVDEIDPVDGFFVKVADDLDWVC